MTNVVSLTLHNAQQGHVALMEAWKLCKAHLTAGTRLELTVRHLKRSPRQNRRYWGGGVLAQIAAQAAVNGRMYSAESWHEHFKRQFIGVDELPSGQVIGKSSKDLTTKEFCKFCEQVEAYAVTDLGVVFEDLQPWPTQ
jgi:hypothetical protein